MPTKHTRARLGRPPTNHDPEFEGRLRAFVGELPGGAKQAGEICGLSKRIIEMWLAGKCSANKATKAGVLALLDEARQGFPDYRRF